MDTGKSSATRAIHPDVDERIREDATAHPARTYSEHVAAAAAIAAEEYRREIRAMADADVLDDEL